MTILGVTGPSGAGKTTALREFARLGGCVLDCDAIYHRLLRTDAALLSDIEAAFPGTVREGELDRKALAARVFSDPEALLRLNAVTHPRVRAEVQRLLAKTEAPFAVIDAVGLFEGGLAELCDETVAVVADESVRLRRLMERDDLSAEAARARIRAQKSAAEFAAPADVVLENNGTEQEFQTKVRRYISLSKHTEELRKTLLRQPKNGYDRITEAERAEIDRYCKSYIDFIDGAKTEREAVQYTVAAAEDAGFVPFEPGMALKPGDRIYRINRGKSAIFAVIGHRNPDSGVRIVAAHVDSPRLDIKPDPLTEDTELAYLRTHYYGGIKKYQWTTIPLSLHGVIAKKDGSVLTVRVGDDPSEPCFCVTDLLVHLASEQMQKPLAKGVTGENLRILVGSEPLAEDDGADRVKLAILALLYERYGIVEEDLLSAELTMVPAGKAREIGFDRSMIGAYGQDDRVCAWAAFEPLLSLEVPEHTAICMLADKEEIGSQGVSSMQSLFFETFMADLCAAEGGELYRCFEASFCISSDVAAAYDPVYAEAFDRQNSAMLGRGICLCKYVGARGKSGTNDASAEIVARLRRLFDDNGVVWQMSELGKVDQGGGGTVAVFMAKRNIDTIDAGVPVLSMHAPMEIVSKLDCYMTRKGLKAIYEDGRN